jgi:ATP-dependent protease ClpP protease subunit
MMSGKITASASTKYYELCLSTFSAFEDHDFYGPKAQHIYLYGVICQQTIHLLRKDLENILRGPVKKSKAKQKPIVLHLHSPGGSSELGMTLVSFIKEISIPVAIVVDGKACSAATPLLVAGMYRVMHDLSFVMIHEGSVQLEYSKFNNARFDIQTYLPHIEETYMKMYQNQTRVPLDVLNDMMSRDIYMNATTCLKWNVVDRVLSLNNSIQSKMKDPVSKLFYQGKHYNPWDIKLNHIFHYDLKPSFKSNTEDDLKEKITTESLLRFVQPLQLTLEKKLNKNNRVPVVIHNNMFSQPSSNWFDISTIMIRVLQMPIPVYSIIDSALDLITALPSILAYKRYMYNTACIMVRLVFTHQDIKSQYYHDIKHNTELLRQTIGDILKKTTRLPKTILDTLFEQRIMLSAQDCLKYGMVDEIIDQSIRPSLMRGRN